MSSKKNPSNKNKKRKYIKLSKIYDGIFCCYWDDDDENATIIKEHFFATLNIFSMTFYNV